MHNPSRGGRGHAVGLYVPLRVTRRCRAAYIHRLRDCCGSERSGANSRSLAPSHCCFRRCPSVLVYRYTPVAWLASESGALRGLAIGSRSSGTDPLAVGELPASTPGGGREDVTLCAEGEGPTGPKDIGAYPLSSEPRDPVVYASPYSSLSLPFSSSHESAISSNLARHLRRL